MIRTIDRSKTHIVQKLTNPKGIVVAYQSVPIGSVGDTESVTRCSTLAEARKASGINYGASVAQREA